MAALNFIRGVAATMFVVVGSIFWCTTLYLFYLVRVLVIRKPWRVAVGGAMDRLVDGWVGTNTVGMKLCRVARFRVTESGEPLNRRSWYAIVSNHQSWADILILQMVFLSRTPVVKFFTKRELIYVPFVGLAMWTLGFPYVYRYSREKIAANPSLRGRDREATLKACERFKERPVAALGFCEGTRFTTEKHARTSSPYRHLLKPRTGGLSYVLEALRDKIEHVVDVTIVYAGEAPGFWAFLCGKCAEVHVHIETVPASEFWERGLRDRVDELWREKDERVARMRSNI